MMKRTHARGVALASLALLASAGVAPSSRVVAQQAPAQQTASRADNKRWDYCSVTPSYEGRQDLGGWRYYYVVRINYHKPSGTQQESFESFNSEEAMSKALAKLGEDGWEMTGVAAFSGDANGGIRRSTFYFKRPR